MKSAIMATAILCLLVLVATAITLLVLESGPSKAAESEIAASEASSAAFDMTAAEEAVDASLPRGPQERDDYGGAYTSHGGEDCYWEKGFYYCCYWKNGKKWCEIKQDEGKKEECYWEGKRYVCCYWYNGKKWCEVKKEEEVGDICRLPRKSGPCRAYIPRWYFDTGSGRCREFIYGGCQGNANNFDTLQECQYRCKEEEEEKEKEECYWEGKKYICCYWKNGRKFCEVKKEEEVGDICRLPRKSGPCYGSFPRWFFDTRSGRCREFIYGGCQGNANNFETLQDCRYRCVKEDEEEKEECFWEGKQYVCCYRKNGKEWCEVKKEEEGGDICRLPEEPGPCFAYLPRWFFDTRSGRCREFIYGGCHGNANNFDTLQDCRYRCGTEEEEKKDCYWDKGKYICCYWKNGKKWCEIHQGKGYKRGMGEKKNNNDDY